MLPIGWGGGGPVFVFFFFCCALLCVLSGFAIILKRKRELVALPLLSCGCLVTFFLSFSIYGLALAFEHYRQMYIVHSGLQDESLQVTISKLP